MKRRKVIDNNPFTEAYIKQLAIKNDVQGLRDFRETLTGRQKLKLKNLRAELFVLGLQIAVAGVNCYDEHYLEACIFALLGLVPLSSAVYNHSKRKKEAQENIELVDEQIAACNKRLVKEN